METRLQLIEKQSEETRTKIMLHIVELNQEINKGKSLVESEETFQINKKIYQTKKDVSQTALNYSMGYASLNELRETMEKNPEFRHMEPRKYFDLDEISLTEKLVIAIIKMKTDEILLNPKLLSHYWIINKDIALFGNNDAASLILNYIPEYSVDYYSLRASCKKIYIFFAQRDLEKSARRLAKCIKDAEFERAKRIAEVNPLFIFEKITCRNANGNEEIISPLQLSFKLYSSYHIEIFFEIIKNDFNLLEKFKQQYEEQKEFFSIDSLCGANGAYERFDTWFNTNYAYAASKSKKKPSEKFIDIVGTEQACLPIHMLKEFCRERYTNHDGLPKMLKNEKSLLSSPPLASLYYHPRQIILSSASICFLGKDFVLSSRITMIGRVARNSSTSFLMGNSVFDNIIDSPCLGANAINQLSKQHSPENDREIFQAIWDSAATHFKEFKDSIEKQIVLIQNAKPEQRITIRK